MGTLASNPLFLLLALVFIALIVQAFVRMGRDPRELRRKLECDGFRIQRMQLRYFTRGPFREMRTLPGMKFSDRLYRIEALDRRQMARVAWVRLFNRRPWQPLRWELRYDDQPHAAQRGIGPIPYLALLGALIGGFLAVWMSLAQHMGFFG